MNKQFLDEVWELMTTTLDSACGHWASYELRGEDEAQVIVLWPDDEEETKYWLNRHELEKVLRAMYDFATERLWSGSSSYYQDWANVFIAGIAEGDTANWDDEIVNVLVQLATLGDIEYE